MSSREKSEVDRLILLFRLLQLLASLHYTMAIVFAVFIRIEMARILSDTEIQQLLAEPKQLPLNWENRLRLIRKAQGTFSQRDFSIQLTNRHEFKLILRSNHLYPLDFSVILVFKDIDNVEYILRRHNGLHSSKHTNIYEKRLNLPNAELPVCFHRHLATERYQKAGLRIDGYAEQANDYNDIGTARDLLIREAGFVLPMNYQHPMSFGDN